jgi:polysaccharide biosynthesis protein PslH
MHNVVFHGEIPQVQQFMSEHSVSIVPLFSGSGIRVKILEAMMLGRVVLTTSMGLEGINAHDGEHVLIANTPYDFAEKIRFCIENPEEMLQISENARAFAITHFDNLEIGQRVINAYESQLKKKGVFI